MIFDDEGMICSMSSDEGEVVPFLEKVSPKDYSVEIWCKDVENMMIETIRFIMVEAIKE